MGRRTLISASDLAKELDKSEQTLANWRYLGKGPRYYRVGGSIRYDRADVEAWLEKNAHGAPAA